MSHSSACRRTPQKMQLSCCCSQGRTALVVAVHPHIESCDALSSSPALAATHHELRQGVSTFMAEKLCRLQHAGYLKCSAGLPIHVSSTLHLLLSCRTLRPRLAKKSSANSSTSSGETEVSSSSMSLHKAGDMSGCVVQTAAQKAVVIACGFIPSAACIYNLMK